MLLPTLVFPNFRARPFDRSYPLLCRSIFLAMEIEGGAVFGKYNFYGKYIRGCVGNMELQYFGKMKFPSDVDGC